MINQNVKQIQSDTLSILLSNRINSGLADKARSIKIAKCCKIIRDKTKDNVLYNACRQIIKSNSNGDYAKVIRAIGLAEFKYFEEYIQSNTLTKK